MIIDEEDYFAHYGILRKSGRYPWGSGDTQSARNRSFLETVEGLRKDGMSETDIARGFGMTTTQLRAVKSIAKTEERQAQISQAQRMKNRGWSNVAIGERMGLNESSVRALLAPGQKDKADVLEATANMLKKQVAEKGLIDIGTGTEHSLPIGDNPHAQIGISATKLQTAVERLKEEGYKVHYLKVQQLGTGKETTLKVLSKPGVEYSEVYRNRDKVKTITDHSEDGGRSYLGLKPPKSLSSKRVKVRYAEEGGTDADGVIYVRPGVDDLSLGKSRYAQVRIAVDGTHYLKGMAMYKDDLPAGVDVVFNTNKSNTGNKLDAMKPMKTTPDGKVDMDNPFGASIKPGGQRGVHNIVNEEGDWSKWSSNLSSQMLSKQSPSLAKSQLNMTYERKKQELDDIMALTNPSVRRKLLESFADDADSSAVHLQAAALPRQKGSHVILPVNSMKPTEIYAPNYRNGEKVVLIRHPHGGIFEIPELTVNNRHPEAKKLLGNAKDAVGIHSKVAERLSGADFDGDTVLVIPNNSRKVKTAPALQGLKNFDPQMYKLSDDSPIPRMSARTKQFEMGDVSNLITDMTIRGAGADDLARAVRHSMVVIDAEKHHLDYRQSAKDNGIKQLKEKYQGKANAGARTLISRASSRLDVDDRKPRSAAEGGPVDRDTGRKMYTRTGEGYTNAKGQWVPKKIRSVKLAETDDANTLSSGTPIEKVYADHSNSLKALANQARKNAVNTKGIPYSPSAKTAYSNEVASLNAKLKVALKNAPLERQAQVLANAVYSQKLQANPSMEASDKKKIKGQALAEARLRTGAHKQRIDITPSEWAAIQAGAISNNKLNQILNNADLDRIKELATPRTSTTVSVAKKNRAAAMLASGYTQAEVADALGVSVSALQSSFAE